MNSGNASINAVLTTDIVVNENILAADGSLGADPDHLRMWRPIGDTTENAFKGTFDGQGHSVSGLYFYDYDNSNESGVDGTGLFGVSEGIIQNVGLEDSYFNYYYTKIDGQLMVCGAVAGICAINDGQIVNCYNAGTILGSVVSRICVENSDNGKIENCYNTGIIHGFWAATGICNLNMGILKNCYNNSDITVVTNSSTIDEDSYTSGICNINYDSGRIENCYHVGQINDATFSNNICNLNIGQMQFQLDADSELPEGLTLAENSVLSGAPEKAAETVKTTLILTVKNGTTKKMKLTFHIAKVDPTVEVAVSGDSHTEGDLVGELELILSESSTNGVVKIVSEIKSLVAGKNTLTWEFTPEDENNYNMITGTVVVNAQTTTTTTTTVTTTTTKPGTTTTSKTTVTTKPSTTTTSKATDTTNKTTSAMTTKTTTMSTVTTTNTTAPSYGDINLDGKVDIADAIFLNKYLATLI